MVVSLANFNQKPRLYQKSAVLHALRVLKKGEEGVRVLFSSPTGTGKGSIELGLLKVLKKKGYRTKLLTPSLDIIRGFLERCGGVSVD